MHTKTKEENNLGCMNCLFTTTEEKELKKHNIYCERKDFNLVHNCHLCQYSSIKKWLMMRHIETTHEQIKTIHCNLCDFSCLYYYALNIHKYEIHQIGDSRYICPFCSKFCYYSQKLRSHMSVCKM